MSVEHKVLVITGGFISGLEKSILQIILRQVKQLLSGRRFWFELMIKFVSLDPILRVQKTLKNSNTKYLLNLFNHEKDQWMPDLTEVILATLLKKRNMPFQLITIDKIFSDKNLRKKFLKECDVIFLSTTFLRDFSELKPILNLIGKDKKIVIGGPMVQLFSSEWSQVKEVDLIVKGSGELAIDAIIDWINQDFVLTKSYANVDLVTNSNQLFLNVKNTDDSYLDNLTSPDWSVVEDYYKKTFNTIHYESVRGCPYRCAFCNYPFLFNDDRFRYKTATKITSDWMKAFNKNNQVIINCLDSLFTMPKKRLIELCDSLIRLGFKGKWICYARAEDLKDLEICKKMKEAGAIQVQIGLESGSEQILENMNKGSKLEDNITAIKNCKQAGITSVVSLIIGFPGETRETIAETYSLLELAKPDFYFLAPLSTRVQNVPMLNDLNRKKYDIWTDENNYTTSPYWSHLTMSCEEVGEITLELEQKIAQNRISLNAFSFYPLIKTFCSDSKEELLDLQRSSLEHKKIIGIIRYLVKFTKKMILKDIEKRPVPCERLKKDSYAF